MASPVCSPKLGNAGEKDLMLLKRLFIPLFIHLSYIQQAFMVHLLCTERWLSAVDTHSVPLLEEHTV